MDASRRHKCCDPGQARWQNYATTLGAKTGTFVYARHQNDAMDLLRLDG